MDAAVTRLDRRLRASDLDDLPHEWDTRYELIAGVLHMSRRPPGLLRLVRAGDAWREERLGPSDRLSTPLLPRWDGVVLGDLLG